MRITSITATTHKVPVALPLLDRDRERRIVFTTVETDEGITGYTASPPNRSDSAFARSSTAR